MHGAVGVLCRLLALSLLALLASAATAQAVSAAGADAVPTLQVFVRDGCPHCAEAEAFLPAFAAARPGLRIELRHVDRDPAARDELIRHSQQAGVWPPGVPSFAFGGELLVGFDSGERSGPLLAALVDRVAVDGRTGAADPAAGDDTLPTRWFGPLAVDRLGLPLFTLAVGLIDGFNPCAMWVLLFLLSMLVHLRDRRRMALIAGTFVLVSGAVYYAFMAAWLNLFLAVGFGTTLRIVLALLALLIGIVNIKDFLFGLRGLSLSIPAAAHPGLYARVRAVLAAETLTSSLFAVVVLALLVNLIELLCTAGLPALYTAILSQHAAAPAAYYGYLGLYIVGYIADDALMVAVAVSALGSRRLGERGGRWLKLVSGAVMLLLGALLLLRPQWLF